MIFSFSCYHILFITYIGIVAYNHPMEYNKEQLGEETM